MRKTDALACATLLTGILGVAPATASASQEPFNVDTLFQLDRVTGVALSPAGDRVAVVSERWTEKSYMHSNSTLWLVSTRGGPVRRAVQETGELSQTHPLWSPDGKMLAYRARGELDTRLRLIHFGPEQTVSTLQVCGKQQTVGALTWSPDAKRMAVICDAPLRRPPEKSAVIVATQSSHYRGNGEPLIERRVVLFDIATGSGREIARSTSFLSGEGAVVWREPDTLWIMGVSEMNYAVSYFAPSHVIHRYDLNAGKLTTLPHELPGPSGGLRGVPAVSPDGHEFMVTVGGSIGDGNWRNAWKLIPLTVKRFDSLGRERVSTQHPREVFLIPRGTVQAWVPAPDKRAGGMYYLRWQDRASRRIMAFSPSTGQWSDITPEAMDVETFSISADGTRMAVVGGDANTPKDVYVVNLLKPSAKPLRLTRFEDAIRGTYSVSSVEKLRWRSKDDRFDIDGWLLKPAGYVPGKRYPMILDVHGGPAGAFNNSFEVFRFSSPHQVASELYAARGYMVLMVNPRGDPGYGRAYQEALMEGWGPATINDLFAGVDEAIRLGYADPDRLAIAGGSYGGWVTAFAVSQTDRFKAASANDPVIDSGSAAAVAYRGDRQTNYWLFAGLAGAHLFEKPFETVNPTTINTPILLRFGLGTQAPFPSPFFVSGLPYFTYLDTHCKPVEMILHPEEGHVIGNWTTLRDYIQRNLAWFDYFVKGEGKSPLPERTCPRM